MAKINIILYFVVVIFLLDCRQKFFICISAQSDVLSSQSVSLLRLFIYIRFPPEVALSFPFSFTKNLSCINVFHCDSSLFLKYHHFKPQPILTIFVLHQSVLQYFRFIDLMNKTLNNLIVI
jgi:hypothetical protein